MKGQFDHVKKLPFLDSNIRFSSAHKQHVNKGWIVESTSHRAFEILIVLEGTQLTKVNGNIYILNKGDIFLMPPGVMHENSCISNDGLTYFCAHFDIDEPQLRYQMIKSCDFIYTPASPIYNNIVEILFEWISYVEQSTPYTTYDKLQLQIILLKLLSIFTTATSIEENSINSNTILFYANQLANTIRTNFRSFCLTPSEANREKLSINYIAKSLGISMGYSLEVFRKVYDLSPKEYLSQLKFQESKILLQQPDISLEEISVRIGYKNVSHFSRQFKLWSSQSPNTFRKVHLANGIKFSKL